jgi:acyl-coenzyme A synthetase/AMP-(fatty) acid ligase
MDASAAVPEPAMTVGRPLPGVGLRIEPLPGAAELEDGCGELLCAHPFGFVGYVDDEGMPLQSATSSLSGWSSPRDLARLHPDGSVEVLGRTDHATKRDGRLVMLAEVERVLGQLPGVERVLVALGGETIRGRAMIAFVTLRSPEGEHCDGAELRQRCVELLPAYAIPDELRPIAEFPMLPSGKVDRQRLTALACLPKRRKNTTDNREELGGRGQND